MTPRNAFPPATAVPETETEMLLAKAAAYIEGMVEARVEDYFQPFAQPPEETVRQERKTLAYQAEIAKLTRAPEKAAPHPAKERNGKFRAETADANLFKKRFNPAHHPSVIFSGAVSALGRAHGLSIEVATPLVRRAMIDCATRHAETGAEGEYREQLLEQLVRAHTRQGRGLA